MKRSGPMKVLIADSDRRFVRQCCHSLAGCSLISEVRSAHSGMQCMDILKNFTPTVIFLGVDLERMNGLVTARFIRSRYAKFTLYFLADRVPRSFVGKMDEGIVDGYFSKTQLTHIIADTAALRSLTAL